MGKGQTHLNKIQDAHENLKKQSASVGTIIVIVILVLIILVASVSLHFGIGHIKKHWSKYRCKPYVTPFAGLVGPKDKNGNRKSATEVHAECMAPTLNKSSDEKLKGVHKILDEHLTASKIMADSVNDARKMVHHMRNAYAKEVHDIQHKIHNVYERVAYIFKLIEKLAVRLFIIFADLFNLLKYLFYFVANIWNGEIGKLMRFFCFDENTIIDFTPIKDVTVGGNITHKFVFDRFNEDVYNIYGIKVSGEHLISHNNKYIPVKKHPDAQKICYDKQLLYCIGTKDGKIKLGQYEFKDYFDQEGDKLTIFYKNVFNIFCKRNKLSFEFDYEFGNSGIVGYTVVHTQKEGFKEIQNINVGDILWGDNTVVGKVESEDETYFFHGVEGAYGTLIIINDKVIQLGKIGTRTGHRKKIYHLFTEKEHFEMNNIHIVDFETKIRKL